MYTYYSVFILFFEMLASSYFQFLKVFWWRVDWGETVALISFLTWIISPTISKGGEVEKGCEGLWVVGKCTWERCVREIASKTHKIFLSNCLVVGSGRGLPCLWAWGVRDELAGNKLTCALRFEWHAMFVNAMLLFNCLPTFAGQQLLTATGMPTNTTNALPVFSCEFHVVRILVIN